MLSTNRLLFLFSSIAALFIFFNCQRQTTAPAEEGYPLKTRVLDPAKAADLASKIEKEVNLTVDDDLELKLWASDSLVHDPIAISIGPDGRIFYTSATRQRTSEFDVRGHRHWITASISFQSIEDRRKFLRENFAEGTDESERVLKDLNEDGVLDWRDLTVEKEEVWFVMDESGDGLADKSQLYLSDFNEEITDVANGLEYHDGQLYLAVGPDMWRTADTDEDGIANETESLSRGYAIHIGFSGHGMSGATIGPDGRLWWGIGDIGMNVVDKDGKRWKYPNRGVIVRSELDGSGFEVFCHGVRNTHEFAFDKYGNLITEDNDGDHSGERERLVYLLNGSDTGWRINWQFGKYEDDANNNYKVWMDEKMHVPHWDGQAAYFLPCIQNYINGPTGFVYNPGTALSPDWYDHFFVAEFRGTAAQSPIHAFTLKPKGASFELAETKKIVEGLLPTGLDFGTDGALYFGDWIEGWGVKDEGRIWKMDVKEGKGSDIRQATQKLLESDFSALANSNLGALLGHQDMRVRQRAQFTLAKRGEEGFNALLAVVKNSDNQLARIHGLWGIGQLARLENMDYAQTFVPFLQDEDTEIVTQATKMIGDVYYSGANTELMALLERPSLRLQLHAAEALGRNAATGATEPILKVIEKNNDEDLWLRHAGMVALGRIGNEKALAAEANNDSAARRIAAVVALRHMSSPSVAVFLKDESEFIAAEAARAINDDYSIEAALPALANILNETSFTSEPLIRRAINANDRLAQAEQVANLVAYAKNTNAPTAMRAEALAALAVWEKPSVFDRVDGRYRGERSNDPQVAVAALQAVLPELLAASESDIVVAAATATGKLKISDLTATLMNLLQQNSATKVREAALQSLYFMESDQLDNALEIAFNDRDKQVRSKALELLPQSTIPTEKSIQLFEKVLTDGSIIEQQTAYAALGEMDSPNAITILHSALDQLLAGTPQKEVQLDIISAVEAQADSTLLTKLADYQATKPADDALALFREALHGGNAGSGRGIFYWNSTAQCTRCHAIFEYGGNAGPNLMGVANRLTDEELLESVVHPSAKLAAGYGVVILELQNEDVVSGIVLEETETDIRLKIGKEDIQTVSKVDIKSREDLPSSMPTIEGKLSKKEIRDLVAYLGTLEGEES
ncbi:MAG: heme-binding protein [Saprospiraceae bacterium]